MNAKIMVDNTLNQILRVLKPSLEDWETRLRILQYLQGAVESVEGLRGESWVIQFHVSEFYLCTHLICVAKKPFWFDKL